ncbi:MAG TPA: hypothetical protein VKV36_02015 [Acidimicrobiales bacterium]|nr:hypothetical protein [Acidimicrobiales bacterium]
MDALLRRLLRTAFRRGLGTGSPAWLLLGAAAWLLRRARRRQDAPVLSVPVRVGDRLLLTLRGPGDRPGDESGGVTEHGND